MRINEGIGIYLGWGGGGGGGGGITNPNTPSPELYVCMEESGWRERKRGKEEREKDGRNIIKISTFATPYLLLSSLVPPSPSIPNIP